MGWGSDPRRVGKWMLLAAFVLFVPVPFVMIVVGGLIPLAAILFLALQGAAVGLTKLSSEAFLMLGILFTHVLILGGLLYLAASLLSRLLYWLSAAKGAHHIVLAVVLVLFVMSWFEIYRLPGHGTTPPANILRVFRAFAA